MSSINQVMKTAELLEAVLLYVDMRTILTSAQLVSRQWHDLIAHSPSLQQVIYFKPSTTTAAAGSSVPSPRGTTLNPLLAEVFPYWFGEPPPRESGRGPHFFELSNLERAAPTEKEWLIMRIMLETGEDKVKKDKGSVTLESIMYPEATWRRMLVRQPPVLAMGLYKLVQERRWDVSHELYRLEFQDDGGLRMGHLFDLTHMWIKAASTFIYIIWEPRDLLPRLFGRDCWEEKEQRELAEFGVRVDATLYFAVLRRSITVYYPIKIKPIHRSHYPSPRTALQPDRWGAEEY